MSSSLARAVLKVGDGRGFVVECRGRHAERIVITAAHCLEHARLASGTEGLPPCHPLRHLEEETYPAVLGRLDGEPTIWATCLFIDPIADIAVLGQPDNQSLPEQAEAYDQLMESVTPLPVADAPAEGRERVKLPGSGSIERPTPGEGSARVLSLKGRWLAGQVERRGNGLAFEPRKHFVGGISGSPIIDASGAAIGVCSTEDLNPVIVDNLSAQLVRRILAGSGANPVPIRAIGSR